LDTADTPRKAFYKKEHRWKDGLVSAAQAVGWCANVLVDTVAEALTSIEAGEGTWSFHLVLCFALTCVFALNQTKVWTLFKWSYRASWERTNAPLFCMSMNIEVF
jgi:hypothetical protein